MSIPLPRPTRRRLDVAARRLQLLEVGADLLSTNHYENLAVDDVARAAGVSVGLLYHYFGNKHDFFVEVVKNEAQKLALATEPDPTLSPREQLLVGLDAYIDYIATHRSGYRAVHRGALGSDPTMQAIISNSLAAQRDRILSALYAQGSPSARLQLAVEGWIAFLITVCLSWLDDQTVTRVQLRDQCIHTLRGAIIAASMEPPSSQSITGPATR